MTNQGLTLIHPRVEAPLDKAFHPAVLASRHFRESVRASGETRPIGLAIEQADGSIFHFNSELFPETDPRADANFIILERCLKFLLWSVGGFRVHADAPITLVEQLRNHYRRSPPGQFDAEIMGGRIYERPFEVIHCTELPPECSTSAPLGRHLEGHRIGFDLGGSDRKVAALIDGEVVFSEETVWDPYHQPDPQYHRDGIIDSLMKAAAHLPKIDAIGGSAAGVYVNNRVKVASLFRGVPRPVFESQVKDLFLDVRRRWGVPLEVVNDGEVTALAASMSLRVNAVLGIALGTSVAAGYVNREGNITTRLNELAFVPLDYRRDAPIDEWSGDYGCGVQYFSQQAVGRLMPAAGIDCDNALPLPERLKLVQSLMSGGDVRALKIFQTIGVYLGYGVAHYAGFYDFDHVLVLGRVTSGAGGEVIIESAGEVLKVEFPELAERVRFHVPDEKEKRHGQAIAAASLPKLH